MKSRIVLTICVCTVFLSGPSVLRAQDTLQSVPSGRVILKADTLFDIFAPLGPYQPSERVNIINQRIDRLLSDPPFSTDSLHLFEGELSTDILYGDQIILSVTDGDAKPLSKTRRVVAQETLKKLQDSLGREKKSKSVVGILIQVGLTLLELLVLYILIKYINKLFTFVRKWLVNARERVLKGIRFRGYELLDTNRELQVALFLNNLLRWTVIIVVMYLAIPILFSIFPWTRGLADKLFGYVLSPIRNIFVAIINYIPNLFTILVIYFATRYAVKFFRFLADEVEKGALKIPSFYPDWALPTFNIVRVLLYAFMFITVFKYLPGSDSPVFQGVSVFLGILFSLGSTSAISNAVAGMVITYMRPFKIGDRIRIGEITGDVIEKSLLVTRIRTIKNEDITLPNSAVLSGHTVNYTSSATDEGLVLYTGVTIGYDVPWRQVHELLINAALATNGISQSEHRKPFVLQTSLDDFYVAYQINAFTHESHRMAAIYSELHQNIQDKFNEGGVEILSPHYRAARDGNMTTIPANYLPEDYQTPSFNFRINKEGIDQDNNR